jgi:heme exporter protein C
MKKGLIGWLGLWTVTTVALFVANWMVFIRAPEERVMGAAQRIFYFHVPCAMFTYIAVAVLLAGSMTYLWRRDLYWDNLSRAATEVAILFCTLVLVSGPIWARSAWGTWWTWEARITTTLLLWLLLIACLMIRRFADSRELGARLAAIVGIVAALDVPIIHKAVTWWRGQHPEVFKPGEGGGLDPAMQGPFVSAIIGVFLLGTLFLVLRFRLAQLEDRATALSQLVGAEGGWR